MNALTIGKSITDLRKEMGYSQAQFAEMLNVSPQAVSKWERGASLPDVIMLSKIAEAAGKDLSYFEGEPDKNFEGKDAEPKQERIRRPFNMSMSHWKDADFSGMKNMGNKFSFSNIERCIFKNSDLDDTVLKANNITKNDFSNAGFRNARISMSNVEGNDFSRCNFTGAAFTGSNIDKNSFKEANFTAATLKGCNVDETNDFSGAVLSETYFKNSNLSKVRFCSDMINCAFEGCDMRKSVFENVNFYECFFKNQSLKKAVFINCTADRITYAFLKSAKADLTGISLRES